VRTAGLPTFRKLYRMVQATNLYVGDVIRVMVNNVYSVSGFGGQKSFVLSTVSGLGGKNSFLGWAFIVVGLICFFLAAVFGIKHKISPRPIGDMKYFNWPGANRQSVRGGLGAGGVGIGSGGAIGASHNNRS